MALKLTAGYIPAADCVVNFNQTTKEKRKSLTALYRSFNTKQRKFNSYSEDYAVLFYTYYSISIVN